MGTGPRPSAPPCFVDSLTMAGKLRRLRAENLRTSSTLVAKPCTRPGDLKKIAIEMLMLVTTGSAKGTAVSASG